MNTTRFNNDSDISFYCSCGCCCGGSVTSSAINSIPVQLLSRFHSIQFLTSIPEESVHFHLILHNSTQFHEKLVILHTPRVLHINFIYYSFTPHNLPCIWKFFLCSKIFALTSQVWELVWRYRIPLYSSNSIPLLSNAGTNSFPFTQLNGTFHVIPNLHFQFPVAA